MTDLGRRAGLQRTAGLSRSAPLARTRRDTGFPRAVKLATRRRAGGGDITAACCEACRTWLGAHGGDIQHRLARGMGGSTSRVINGLANALLLCRSCHQRCEARDPEMETGGFWIRSGNGPDHDPRFVPVLLGLVRGGGTRVWLSETGGYLPHAPEGTEAA